MNKYVLIMAAGSGQRINAKFPKQFLELNGKPILMHTFEAFSFLENQLSFILVLAAKDVKIWRQLCEQFDFTVPHQVAEGGPKRFYSVKGGLKYVPDNSLIAIHDGVRPFVSKQTIADCFEMAKRKGSAVPVIRLDDSLREVSGSLSKAVDRDKFRKVQTPQIFQSSIIKRAYHQAFHESFTDDATVYEQAGGQIYLVEGNRENIKITNPNDLELAKSNF